MYLHKFSIKLQSTSVTSQYFFWIFLLVFCAWWVLLHAHVMSSSEKRDLLYEKAKEFWRSRKKHVRLNVPKHLDVEAEISKDLRRLASFDFQPDELPQSEVTCETYNSLFTVTRKLKFGEMTLLCLNLCSFLKISWLSDEFWDFLYSDEWSDFTTLRIKEGHLLSLFVDNLFILSEKGNLRTVKYTRFDSVDRFEQSSRMVQPIGTDADRFSVSF